MDESASRNRGEPLSGHKDNVRPVAFSPNGRFIVSGSSGSNDETVRIWNRELWMIKDRLEEVFNRLSKMEGSMQSRQILLLYLLNQYYLRHGKTLPLTQLAEKLKEEFKQGSIPKSIDLAELNQLLRLTGAFEKLDPDLQTLLRNCYNPYLAEKVTVLLNYQENGNLFI